MQAAQPWQQVFLANLNHLFDNGIVLDDDILRCSVPPLVLIDPRLSFGDQNSKLLMEFGREEPELTMLNAESSTAFMNAALAQNQTLPAPVESRTDHAPLFERKSIRLLQRVLPVKSWLDTCSYGLEPLAERTYTSPGLARIICGLPVTRLTISRPMLRTNSRTADG